MAKKVKDETVAISGIKIKLGGREIELTAEEAHKLQVALNDLFALQVAQVEEHHHHHVWPTYQPIYVRPYIPSWPDRWTFTCASTGTSIGTGGCTSSNFTGLTQNNSATGDGFSTAAASGMLMMDLS